jgi:hypothetical protein
LPTCNSQSLRRPAVTDVAGNSLTNINWNGYILNSAGSLGIYGPNSDALTCRGIPSASFMVSEHRDMVTAR